MNDDADEDTPNIHKKSRRALKRKDGLVQISKKFSPKFLEDLDTRYHVTRLLRQRVDILLQDAGGDESVQRALLCRRAAFLSIILETAESECLSKGTFDQPGYTQSLNSLTGVLKALGLERRLKTVGGLTTYLAGKEKKP
jgi:hypothetical protein